MTTARGRRKGHYHSKACARIEINFQSAKQLESVFNSLLPELPNSQGNRAHATTKMFNRTLQLNFEADDPTALRAIISSFLRLTRAALNACDVINVVTKQPRQQT